MYVLAQRQGCCIKLPPWSSFTQSRVTSQHPRWQAGRKPYLTEVDFYHLVILTTRIRYQVLLEFVRQRSYVWSKKEGRSEKCSNMKEKKKLRTTKHRGSTMYSLVPDDLWDHARSEVTSDTTVGGCCSQNTPSLELTLLPTSTLKLSYQLSQSCPSISSSVHCKGRLMW